MTAVTTAIGKMCAHSAKAQIHRLGNGAGTPPVLQA
jgi:hypothetical protein